MHGGPAFMFFSAFGGWRELIRRDEWGDTAQPKTGCFEFRYAELPRLNRLVLLAPDQLFGVAVHYTVLGVTGAWICECEPEQFGSFGEFRPSRFIPHTSG